MASKLSGRTAREFRGGAEVWQALDAWALETGYRLVGQDQFSRLYQRGSGLLMAPQMLQMTCTPNGYRLEAWVRVPLLNRIITLGLMPAEIIIDSGGFMAILPRKQAQEHVNRFLRGLGLPPIA
jgi:hypothetical protein